MKFLSSLTKKDLANKICLLRVDLNIQNADLFKKNIHPRILAVLPTIEFLIKNGAKVVILSHRGRPTIVHSSKFKVKSYKQFSLKPFVKILSFLLKKPVYFIDLNSLLLRGAKRYGNPIRSVIARSEATWQSLEIASPSARNDIVPYARNDTEGQFRNLTSGNIFLLENLRFFSGEERNDKKFAEQLASLGGIYINDAFSVCHRANASVTAITKFLPSYAGLLLEKEIKNLDKAIKNPKKPLVMILGGAKVSDKIELIKNFSSTSRRKADYFLIGGGMANTFMAAQGLPVGDSLCEEKMIPLAQEFLKSGKIILPTDTLVYKRQILDVGPKTIEKYSKIIKNAGTIIWNGPMGYIEDKKFRKGSEAIVKAIIKSRAFSIIGGGETISIMSSVKCQMSDVFISTGGGAMLEYLAGKKLPGVEALK